MPRLAMTSLRAPCVLALLGLLLAARSAFGATAHLELDVQLDPATRHLHASARLASDKVPDFALDKRLAITRASVDGRGVAPAALAQLATRPGMHRFAIEYAGTLPPLPGRGLRQDPNPGSFYASPEGSYLAPEAHWYPEPGVPFTYRVKLSLPAGQKGLVPGRQLREREARGRWSAQYEFPHPADGIWLLAGPYSVAQQRAPLADGSIVTVRTWFHPEIAQLAAGYLQDSVRYLQRYSRSIGPYAFGDFSVVSSPLPHGIGIPSLTYLGREVLRLPFIRATSLGHEVLHDWWGNGVVPDWESGNWSEGLTTFGADYTFREDQGADAARTMRLEWLRDLLAIAPADETAVAAFTSRHHGISSVMGYSKPAMVFFMLRDEIGPAAFEQGLRAFWRQHRFGVAGWKDLAQAFGQASGRDLSGFFAQWTQRAASPTLAVQPAVGAQVRIVQQGDPFELLVPLRVRRASGDTRDLQVRVRERETLVDLAASGIADAAAVALDPDLRLWRRLDPASVPAILRETFIAPRAQLHVAATGAGWAEAATALAQRTLDAQPDGVAADALLASPQLPALVAGERDAIIRLLDRLGLGALPAVLQEDGRLKGTARAWAARAANGKPFVFILADTPAALAALQRALPHYGRQSWLVFQDDRVVAQGAFPAAVPWVSLR